MWLQISNLLPGLPEPGLLPSGFVGLSETIVIGSMKILSLKFRWKIYASTIDWKLMIVCFGCDCK